MRYGRFTQEQLAEAAAATKKGINTGIFPVCGGLARAVKMSPEERSESSRHANKVRWARHAADKARKDAENPRTES